MKLYMNLISFNEFQDIFIALGFNIFFHFVKIMCKNVKQFPKVLVHFVLWSDGVWDNKMNIFSYFFFNINATEQVTAGM